MCSSLTPLTDSHLWADTYDRKLTDIFTVESEIAKTIADTLQAKLTGSEERAIAARPTENPEADQLYLKGRFFWNKRTAVDLRKSIDYFNQAIEKDPDYALAYAGLAQAWVIFLLSTVAPRPILAPSRGGGEESVVVRRDSADAFTALTSIKASYYSISRGR